MKRTTEQAKTETDETCHDLLRRLETSAPATVKDMICRLLSSELEMPTPRIAGKFQTGPHCYQEGILSRRDQNPDANARRPEYLSFAAAERKQAGYKKMVATRAANRNRSLPDMVDLASKIIKGEYDQ